MEIKEMLHTVCFMRPTRLNALLKGTSAVTFNESPHDVSYVISIITWGSSILWKSRFTVKINDLHQMTGGFQCIQVKKKKICVLCVFFIYIYIYLPPARSHRVHFSVSMSHLSQSNIWLLVKTFLCLS